MKTKSEMSAIYYNNKFYTDDKTDYCTAELYFYGDGSVELEFNAGSTGKRSVSLDKIHAISDKNSKHVVKITNQHRRSDETREFFYNVPAEFFREVLQDIANEQCQQAQDIANEQSKSVNRPQTVV